MVGSRIDLFEPSVKKKLEEVKERLHAMKVFQRSQNSSYAHELCPILLQPF